jgi:CheY-like chemotaxis protein
MLDANGGGTGGGRRVLIVDDDEDSVAGLALLLEADGHQVRTAHDGPTTLETAAEFAPELVVLDLALRDTTGYELARELRSRHGRGPFLLALTGHHGDAVGTRCQEAGFDAHLMKPIVDFDALRALVRSLESRSRRA